MLATGVAAEPSSCAVQPAGEPANVRSLPATCATASFAVDADQIRQSSLLIVAGPRPLYLRALRLTYGGGGSSQTVDNGVARLLAPGESGPPIPTQRDGLALRTVVATFTPPGVDTDPALLALAGSDQAIDETATRIAALDPTQWALVGSGFLHTTQEPDHIVVGPEKGRLDRLIFSSHGGVVALGKVTIVLVEGAPIKADLHAQLAPGWLSTAIEIEPPDFVREVVVDADGRTPTVGVGSAATLEVRGRYDERWRGRTGENRQITAGWVMLGAVDVIASPHSSGARGALKVAGPEGERFKRLRFVARRGTINFGEITVIDDRGREEAVKTASTLLPDAPSPPFTFAAGPSIVQTITMTPRIRRNASLDATVEVWAQY